MPSDLTENEIFATMVENLKIAADASEQLAKLNQQGEVYERLRTALLAIEGCCRQAAFWRGDARWLPMARLASDSHARAGDWLRGWKDPDTGIRVPTAKGEKNRLFLMLAVNMRAMLEGVEALRTRATGKSGMILPDVGKAARNVSRSSNSGLILPPKLAGSRG